MAAQARLFGVETEYAFSAMEGRTALARDPLLYKMMQLGRQKLLHLPDLQSGGMFLRNGSRLYIDCGSHPELATAECATPWELVRCVRAGDRILADLMLALESGSPRGTEVLCFRCNVDYSGVRTTWGSHESYLYRMRPADLQPQIIPHLVSRIVFTGAGGFNPLSPGLEFTVSPRVAHIERVVSGGSTGGRGIFHTKQEPLCERGYNRLHVICGESLCSDTALFLRVGTTALVVAMAEAGLNPGDDVQIKSPLDALRTFAADPTCKKTVRMADWRSLSAIDIQRHYLQKAEAHLGDERMPEWAADLCRVWRDVLGALDRDPLSMSQVLDWPMKLALYANHAESLGVPWDRLPFWNRVLHRLDAALPRTEDSERTLNLDSVLGRNSPIPDEVALLARTLQAKGLDWDELRHLMKVRKKFFEIDTRFSQLGPKGIFQALDAAGVLNHRVEGADRFEQAMDEPPAIGRARIRGEVIQRLAGASDVRCDWQHIIHFQEGRILDLSDPFAREESWRPLRDDDTRSPQSLADLLHVDAWRQHSRERSLHARRQEAADQVAAGDYTGAEALIRQLLQEQFELPSTHCHLARVLLLTDREAEAREQINQAWAIRQQAEAYVVARILFFQIVFAMLDEADLSPVVARMKATLRAGNAHLDWTILPVVNYLRPRLEETNHRFLKALAAALCDEAGMLRLPEFPQWQDTEAPQSA